MNYFQKILGAAVVATLAMSVVATSASAHNPQNYKGTGVLPVLAGPVAAAALFPSFSTLHWTSTLYQKHFYKWSLQNIVKATKHGLELHKTGFKVDVDIKKSGIKIEGKKDVKHSKSSKNVGKAVVGCIFGSALGAITASVRKASAMGNPPRWRSQAEHEKIVASGYEKQFELTNDEAHTSTALCGLGSFALHWQPKAPAPVVVKARY
jgi:hypothetical protein